LSQTTKPYNRGITFGVFDLFHIGHLNLLRRAKDLCNTLLVCISTDEYVEAVKGRTPVIPWHERRDIVSAIKYVDTVGAQTLQFGKREAVLAANPDVIFVGSDWEGKAWDGQNLGVPVVYLPYTEHISTTKLRAKLKDA
jgi:glycerol-3-phosphate cytidylyltransferase